MAQQINKQRNWEISGRTGLYCTKPFHFDNTHDTVCITCTNIVYNIDIYGLYISVPDLTRELDGVVSTELYS